MIISSFAIVLSVSLFRALPPVQFSPLLATREIGFLDRLRAFETSSVRVFPVDDARVAFGLTDGVIRVVHLPTLSIVSELTLPFGVLAPVQFGESISEVYVGTEGGFVTRFDLATQRVGWSAPVQSELFSSALLAGNRVYVTTARGELFAIDRESGAIAWKYASRSRSETLSRLGDPAPIKVRNRIFSGFEDGTLVAVNDETGLLEKSWSVGRAYGDPLWDLDSLTLSTPSGGMERLIAAPHQGGVVAIDPQTLKELWRVPADVQAAPLLSEDHTRFWMVDRNGDILRIAVGTGAIELRRRLNIAGEGISHLKRLGPHIVAFSHPLRPYDLPKARGVHPESGEILWERELSQGIYGEPTAFPDLIVWVTKLGYLQTMRPTSLLPKVE